MTYSQGRPPKYPYDSLAIGESFTIAASDHRGFGRVQSYTYHRNFVLKPKRFTCFLGLDGSVTITRRT
jgi:hypothetical protein